MPRLLIVDDEPDVIAYLKDEVESTGWRADGAANGVEAVMRVLDGGWDAVLMDIRMPKLDGVNALRLIRRIAPRLPVVMLTGQAGQSDMFESARLGAFTCLLKPATTDKLMATLDQAVKMATPQAVSN